MDTFETGAKRSERQKNHFHLIPSEPLRRLARRYALGGKTYGEYNWQKGFPFSDLFNHIQDHLENVKQKYQQAVEHFRGDEEGIRKGIGDMLGSDAFVDDDLAGAVWGCFAIMELARTGRITEDNGWQIQRNLAAEAPRDPRDEKIERLQSTIDGLSTTIDILKAKKTIEATAKRRRR